MLNWPIAQWVLSYGVLSSGILSPDADEKWGIVSSGESLLGIVGKKMKGKIVEKGIVMDSPPFPLGE